MTINDCNFNEAFETLLVKEGGYVNDPNDAGGETKFGISKRSYPHLDIKELTIEKAKEIYYKDFWLLGKCDKILGRALSKKYFEAVVNMGHKQAILCLQRALKATGANIYDDGIIGPETLRVANLEVDVIPAFKSELAGYYRMLAAIQPTNQKFLKGWLNRAYA